MHRESRLHRVIPLIIPIIALLAWSQFNWFQELTRREARRIEASMMDSAGDLTIRLGEELNLLPSLFTVDSYDRATVEKTLRERYRFWMEYAIEPEMLKSIRLLDARRNEIYRWVDGRLEPNPVRTVLSPPVFLPADRSTVRIVSPLLHNGDDGLMVEYDFDKTVIVTRVIPLLAEKYLDESGLYRYRIIDDETGNVIFSSDFLGDAVPDRPDVEIPLMESVMDPFPDGNAFPRAIPGTADPEHRLPPAAFPGRSRPQAQDPRHERSVALSRRDFGNVILQIYNRDVSLARLSRRTSVFNAAVSLGTFALLAFLFASLARTGNRARSLAQRQREFIATVTHELKTPLAVISSAAENLTDGIVRDRDKVTQYGAAIKKESLRLSRTIDHVLLYSRAHSGMRMKPEYCAVSDLVESALRLTEEERSRIGMTTDVRIPEPGLMAYGDRLALESVLINLVQNVVRHAASGKYLGIEAIRENTPKNGKKTAEGLIIKVVDKGPGIPPREHKAIFEPFARGKRAMNEQIPGNGIGLNLVKRVVETHGGTVSLESKPGIGTTFTVILPRMRGVDHACQDSDD